MEEVQETLQRFPTEEPPGSFSKNGVIVASLNEILSCVGWTSAEEIRLFTNLAMVNYSR